jgi:hypothetical protein
MKKRTELRKKDKKLLRLQDEGLEESLREFVHPKHRKSKEINVKKYKRKLFKASVFFFVHLSICLAMGLIYGFFLYDKMPIIDFKITFLCIYLVSVIFPLLPFGMVALTYYLDSEIGRFSMTQYHIRLFCRRTEKVIYLTHHCSDMMVIAKTNADIEYFTSRCQIAARQALLFILRMTNAFIRYRYYDGLKLKYKRLFIGKVTEYLKELNGALIISYKGRVPKYVEDVFTQIYENMLELRKREVRL